MNINVPKPQSVSFFVPVGMGVLAQMFCAGLLMAITAIGFTSTGQHNTIGQTSSLTASATLNSEGAAADSPSIPKNETLLAATSDPAVSAVANTDPPMDQDSSDTPANPPTQPSAEIAAAPRGTPAEVQPVAAGKPLDDVRNKSRTLPIAGEGVPNEIALCLIRASDPTKVDLELLGGEFAMPEELTVKVDRLSSDEKSCVWRVTHVSAVGLVRTQDVGEFLLKDQQFSFRWLKDADKGKLPFCRLRISADSDIEVCDLWSSVHSPALRVSFTKSSQTMDPFVARGVKLPPAELLQLALTFEGWPEHKRTGDTLVLNETLEIVFPDEDLDRVPEDDSARNLLKILLTLKVIDGQPAVHAAYATNVPEARQGNARARKPYDYFPKDLSHKDLENLSSKIEKESDKYQQELHRLGERLNALQDQQAKLSDQVDAGVAQAQSQLDATVVKIKLTEKQQAQAEELSEVFSAAVAAMKQLSELIDDIEGKGHLHFQLTRPLGGSESDVVISSSVNAAAEQAGRVP